MLSNPEQTISFFNRLIANLIKRRKTFVYLEKVKRFDYDAILVLLSIMIKFKTSKVGFNGDFPSDDSANEMLKKSGFFQSLYRNFAEQDIYKIQSNHAIRTHANRSVDSELTAKVIQHSTKTVWGEERRSQGIQRVMVELMQNTNNHASPRQQGEKHWWLSINHQELHKKVSFVFVDLGVGVFNSLDTKKPSSKWFGWRDIMKLVFGERDNSEILKLILKGKLHQTVTGNPFRGKGLPGIDEAFQRNWMSNLLIITNDVYADIAKNEFRVIHNRFNGTMISWELNETNHSTRQADV